VDAAEAPSACAHSLHPTRPGVEAFSAERAKRMAVLPGLPSIGGRVSAPATGVLSGPPRGYLKAFKSRGEIQRNARAGV
jgi:hypothetical protein